MHLKLPVTSKRDSQSDERALLFDAETSYDAAHSLRQHLSAELRVWKVLTPPGHVSAET
jgi:hypothetical protein